MTSKAEKTLSERGGVFAVGSTFTNDFGWFFRELPQPDWGIDAQVEQVENGNPTGKLFALQIKSGSSYFRAKGNDFVYYGDLRHLEYWADHSLPVYIILHHPETGLALWQRVERRICEVHDKGWSIVIPSCNVLDARAKQFFEAGIAANDEGSRRLRFAMDAELMEQIGNQEVYFVWEVWVNKSLGVRNPKIYIGEYKTWEKKDPDVQFDMWFMPTHDVGLAMSIFYPWVEYEYFQDVEEDPEVESHVLVGKLTDAAKGYIGAERFFRDGPDWEPPEAPRAGDQDADFRAALEEDWRQEWEENNK